MIIDLFYFSGGIIFWILGILTFREFRKNRFKNELYLSLYFFGVGWLFPLIVFFPYNAANEQFIKFLFIGANATIPLVVIFLNLFLDYTVYEGQSSWIHLNQFIGGGTTFVVFTLIGSLEFKPISTIFGEYIILDLETSDPLARYVFLLVYVIVVVNLIRFGIVGIQLAKRNANNDNYKMVRRVVLL
ncbi:MAG: hypothetical protein KAR20_18010, partial [Candidatus Heimdallarchaeota archaeon]|nr:hypothetical protein [Candidatus Heimdallarchaeota archaeon]